MTALPAGAPIPVRTTPLPDTGALVDHVPTPRCVAWIRRGEGMVGWGEAARVELSGPGRFDAAAAWWRQLCGTLLVEDEVGVPGTGPVAFGGFTFDNLPGRSVLVVPKVVVGRRGGRAWITTVGDGTRLADATAAPPPDGVTCTDGSLTAEAWLKAVADAVARIGQGQLDKVVLARDLVVSATAPIDPRWVLGRLADRYPGCWTFSVDGLVGATPEMLVRLEKGLLTSRVLAGTIRRTGDDAHDLALAASLARSSKDLEEHEYAVRSVADALAAHCTGMNVPESPFVLHLPNVMHLASDVAGVLADGATSLDIAASLHPTAAVCGTPTTAARSLIRQIEGMERGRYAGPVGWIDARGDGEWGIALRCGQQDPADPRRMRLFAGCGIVAGSDPADELAEWQAKLVPMREALSG